MAEEHAEHLPFLNTQKYDPEKNRSISIIECNKNAHKLPQS